MSEERMERKCVARSVPPKAASGDCKKSSDAAHKPWPRSGKKREGASGGGGKNENFRRSVPAPRGGGRGGGGQRGQARSDLQAVDRADGSGLVSESSAELGSVFAPGSKKQSLNHLLNFVYSPRERVADRGQRAPGARRNNARARTFVRAPPVPHLFLHANCQYAVKPGTDYSEHLLNPDVTVSWANIEHVLVRSEGNTDCPVCLSAPVAARVTRCGHVYCWPCVLHYARVHSSPRPPCPVCALSLDIAELKSAAVLPWPQPQEEICMRLVRRARGSTVVEPAPERESETTSCPTGTASSAPPEWGRRAELPYTKMFLMNKQEMLEIIERERREISDQISAEIDTSELEYLEEAQSLLEKKGQELHLQVEPVAIPPSPVELSAPPTVEPTERSGPKLDWFDLEEDRPSMASLTEDLQSLEVEESACGLETDTSSAEAVEFPLLEDEVADDAAPIVTERDKENQSKYFYFYQGESGEHVFLHSVDVRLLRASWGSLAAAPRALRGRLLRRECYALTYEGRDHMPCTAHLPAGCPYDVVELDLQPPYVTRRALALFTEELEKRARARVRAERDERRRERRAAAASRPPAAPHLSSLTHFPPARSYSPPPPPSPPVAPLQSPPSASGLSFAKMASTSGTWRVREQRHPSPPPPLIEPDAMAPPRVLSLSDAIEAALLAPPTSTSKGARKKNKPKVLFSTGVQRAA